MPRRRCLRLSVAGVGAIGRLVVVSQVSEAQRTAGSRTSDGSRGGGVMRRGGNARADTGGARTSGNGGNRASRSGGGAARTSVNRDYSIASLNTPPTRSTTTQQLDSAYPPAAGFSSLDRGGVNRTERNGNYDLDYDVDYHWHPAADTAVWTMAAGLTTVPVGSLVYTLAPTCMPAHVNTVTYYQCGSVWFQPQFAGTTVTYVAVDAPR